MATGGNINFHFDECQYFKGKYMKGKKAVHHLNESVAFSLLVTYGIIN